MRLALPLFLLLSLLSMATGQETAWRWPLQEGKVLENYSGNVRFPAERLGDPPVIHGMRLTADSEEVYPVGPARPIYLAEPSKGGVNSVAHPLGGLVALEHRGGLRSIYGHLKPYAPYGADAAEPLGRMDGSGVQLGRSLFFAMYDSTEEQSLNPRLLLPERQDRFRPVVGELRLYATGTNRLLWSSSLSSEGVTEGTVTIVAYVHDRKSFDDRYNPYRVTIFANGAQAADLVWDTREAWTEGESLPGGSPRVARVEAPNVTLVDGENRIEVVAEDFRGNVEERGFTLYRRPR